MRRLVSLLILSILVFFSICGSSSGNVYITTSTVNDPDLEQLINKYSTNIQSIQQVGELEYYTDFSELKNILQELAGKYNRILRIYDNLGKSFEGRPIWMVKISDNPGRNEEDETEVLFVGAHHGNELIGNEMAILIITTFAEGYGHDPRITWIVDNHEIWVIPMPNPDGTEYTLNVESWRKNRSPNYISETTPGPFNPKIYPTSYGVDLNRNYDLEWGDPGGASVVLQRSSTYAGPEPFSEFETQSIRDLVMAHNFSVYMDYHSGTELILYPWGYTSEPTPDHALFERLGDRLSELTGYDAMQGYDLYQTNGDSLDWIYSVSRAKAFTVELSNEYSPDQNRLIEVLENNIKQPLYLGGISTGLNIGSQIVISHQEIENQSDLGPYPITANVKGIPEFSNLEVKLYYKVNDGDYHILAMKNSPENPNQYMAEIETQGPGSNIKYSIVVTGEDILISYPPMPYEYGFSIKASAESIASEGEIVAMIIMMIIIMGFFWGGFAYAARFAMVAEQRKLHEYYTEEVYDSYGRIEMDAG